MNLSIDGSLVEHLCRHSPLSAAQARRLVEEVLAFHDETVEAFVSRRHAELQARGLRNPAIYAQIATELGQRRFAAPVLSPRQIRRLIYG